MEFDKLLPGGGGRPALPTPEQLQGWLAGLPADRPAAAAQALMNELLRLRQAGSRSTRLRLYETVRETALAIARETGKRLAASPLPLAQELQLMLLSANALLKTLAAGYAGIVDEIGRKWIGLGLARPLRLATVRAMECQALRLDLAYRVYARGSKSAWSALHRLHRLAREGGFATHKPAGARASAEEIYLHALLLDFAEPTKLAPGELEQVRFYIERHAGLARLGPATAHGSNGATEGRFLVKAGEARAGRALVRAAGTPVAPGDLLLDCTRLLARLQVQIEGLDKGIEPARLGLPRAARRPGYRQLLRNLLRLWGAPPLRRFSRQKFKPRVDLVVGFDDLWTYLAGPANRRRTDERPVKVDTSEWAIANESPGGFSLHYLAGNAAPVRVGEVVGVRPRDQSRIHLCLTRRVVTGDLQSLELGLQKLAPGGVPSMVSVEDRDRHGCRQPRAVRVIVLPRLPTAGNGPALLAPAQGIRPGLVVHLQQHHATLRLRVDRLLEQYAGGELFALLPEDGAGPPAPPAATA